MRLGALAIALAVLLPTTPPVAAAPRTHVVVIDKMKFGPAPRQILAGDRIVWLNKDIFRHTATSRAGGFDVDLPAGAKAVSVINKTGALAVICRYHPGMRMTLQVAR